MLRKTVLALSTALMTVGLAATEPVTFESFAYTGNDEIFTPPLQPGEYRNPILAGYYPDPSICRVGDDYYLINSSFSHFPGIPIFHSTDLVNWTQLGHAIDRPDQLPYDGLGLSRGIFAPAISYHDGLFYIVCTFIDAGGNFVITAEDPAGPWSDPVWLNFDGIDPSIFFDDSTGRAWLVNNGAPPDNEPLYDGHRAIWVQEWDIVNRQLVGPRKIIINGGVDLTAQPVWIEGPHIYKRGDWYYLNCAEGGTSVNHSQVIFRSRQPDGPYTPFTEHPTLSQRDLPADRDHPVTCTGHADFTIGPDGNWWTVFLGCTPYSEGHYNTGRQTFLLPVTWENDWPIILEPGLAVPFVGQSPNGVTQREDAALPLTGNFTWTDDFDGEELNPAWIFMRAPQTTWWSVNEGALHLTPRADALRGKHNPTFVGRRLQHNRFATETTLQLPAASNVRTGLSAYHNETRQYNFGVYRTESGYKIYVEAQRGPADAAQFTLASLAAPPGTAITLRLTGEDTRYIFDYSTDHGASWTQVGGTFDARNLSVDTSYDFIGVLIGLFATQS
ncbi:glycoside hydrolase family 43 protein [Synoicihabitans lomoniglobus]|uniref:Glycoside hydrolase family 43 protein n=1 Tax=Synoicihabitans lomoniglobus TaxID=2909285 RepID=A0AAF0CMJ5_9BACT|nr:glycoside hydrolase family 43 protein [Opitutaceae bacterium LMO-M01]WED63125.1 glycoside hydrolase family 43 protein [Opitutaceae bacterium LMO-M01]